ncbi:MAG TPA: dTMP kinase, partial [Chthoniobacterales bacterium]
MTKRGIFISFEGGEGCGKSTQIARLGQALREARREVVLTREPGGTAVGEQIRHVLQYSKESSRMTPEAELLLFAASRAQLVREVIQPALAAGRVVLSDRFLDSTTVYQGAARRIPAETVAGINQFAIAGLLPDATLVFDLDVAVGRARMRARAGAPAHDRMENEPVEFYEAVRAGYRELARSQPERLILLDAARSPDEVYAELISR